MLVPVPTKQTMTGLWVGTPRGEGGGGGFCCHCHGRASLPLGGAKTETVVRLGPGRGGGGGSSLLRLSAVPIHPWGLHGRSVHTEAQGALQAASPFAASGKMVWSCRLMFGLAGQSPKIATFGHVCPVHQQMCGPDKPHIRAHHTAPHPTDTSEAWHLPPRHRTVPEAVCTHTGHMVRAVALLGPGVLAKKKGNSRGPHMRIILQLGCCAHVPPPNETSGQTRGHTQRPPLFWTYIAQVPRGPYLCTPVATAGPRFYPVTLYHQPIPSLSASFYTATLYHHSIHRFVHHSTLPLCTITLYHRSVHHSIHHSIPPLYHSYIIPYHRHTTSRIPAHSAATLFHHCIHHSIHHSSHHSVPALYTSFHNSSPYISLSNRSIPALYISFYTIILYIVLHQHSMPAFYTSFYTITVYHHCIPSLYTITHSTPSICTSVYTIYL